MVPRQKQEKASPVSEWIVIFEDDAPKIITQQGDTPIGTAAGWSCTASLATGTKEGKRADTFTVTCTKGDVEVRTYAERVDGAPQVALVPLQISAVPTKTPIVTIAFGSRARTA